MPRGKPTTSEHVLPMPVPRMGRLMDSHLQDKAIRAMVVDLHYLRSVMRLPKDTLPPASTRLHLVVWCMHKAMAQCPAMLNTPTPHTGISPRDNRSTRLVRSPCIPHPTQVLADIPSQRANRTTHEMTISMLYLFPLHALHDEQPNNDTLVGVEER